MPTIRYVVFGKIGVGKSTLGNVLLGTNVFKTRNIFEPSTKEPFSHSNKGIVGTLVLNDPKFDDEKLLKDLTSYFQNDFQGPINNFLGPHLIRKLPLTVIEKIWMANHLVHFVFKMHNMTNKKKK